MDLGWCPISLVLLEHVAYLKLYLKSTIKGTRFQLHYLNAHTDIGGFLTFNARRWWKS